MVKALLNENLSDREQEILDLLAQGTVDKQIAHQLHLSLNTVKWHNRQIYAKLGVSNRTQAVAQVKKLGLLGELAELEKPTSRIPHNLPSMVS
ncbi:MAG: LuxR C-terminal-related transcriptional regulator, partial [Anaerolineales bacterium]